MNIGVILLRFSFFGSEDLLLTAYYGCNYPFYNERVSLVLKVLRSVGSFS